MAVFFLNSGKRKNQGKFQRDIPVYMSQKGLQQERTRYGISSLQNTVRARTRTPVYFSFFLVSIFFWVLISATSSFLLEFFVLTLFYSWLSFRKHEYGN